MHWDVPPAALGRTYPLPCGVPPLVLRRTPHTAAYPPLAVRCDSSSLALRPIPFSCTAAYPLFLHCGVPSHPCTPAYPPLVLRRTFPPLHCGLPLLHCDAIFFCLSAGGTSPMNVLFIFGLYIFCLLSPRKGIMGGDPGINRQLSR